MSPSNEVSYVSHPGPSDGLQETPDFASRPRGRMGLRMASNLLKGGHALTVYNRAGRRADALERRGATVAGSAAAAARGADVLITMVADDAVLEATLLGGGVVDAMGRGAIHVSMSTISPALSRRPAEDGRGEIRLPGGPVPLGEPGRRISP